MYIFDPKEINVQWLLTTMEEKISRHENEYFCQMYTTIYKASTSQGPTRPFRLWPQHSTFSTFSKGRSGKILAFIFFSKLKLAVLCAKRPMANLPAAAKVVLNIYYILKPTYASDYF